MIAMKRRLMFLWCAAVVTVSPAAVLSAGQASQQAPPAPPKESKLSKLKSPDDGWLDVGAFLDDRYGFAPIVMPITEPAVGLGIAGGVSFIKPSRSTTAPEFDRPNVTAFGGLGTENGTWGVFGADIRHWGDNRVQTVVGGLDASVNLDFHGTGETPLPGGVPVGYNLQPLGAFGQLKYRLGNSRVWIGASYLITRTAVSFDAPDDTPGLPDTERESRIGGITPSLTYDSRDGLFTPSRGTFVEFRAGLFASALGGDDEFQRISLVAMQYVPVHPRFIVGVRGDGGFTYGDSPFYARPSVVLRGAPVLRYQRDNLAQAELEVRYQFWKRLSAVAFGGYGVVWNNLDTLERQLSVTTGGVGFRYELARRQKLHMGFDVAYGPDGAAFYIQFGSAWARP